MRFPFALLHVGAQVSWTQFSVHWSTVIGLAALGALYAWRAKASPEPIGRTRPILFATAVVVMFLSLNGWLHDLSDYYHFTAHMVQHLLLAMVVAPLFIMGIPGWMIRPALSSRIVARISAPFRSAAVCFAVFNVILIGWHLPPLYNLAMAYHNVHILQHLLLLVASVIMWWPVLSPMAEFPRLPYPGQMLYLFVMTIPMSVLSVAIVYSGTLLYPAYASAPRVLHLSPMDDQLLGGLVMWIPGGLYFFAVISVIFFKWQKAGGLDSRASAQVDLSPMSS
jgi:putative membrane protein